METAAVSITAIPSWVTAVCASDTWSCCSEDAGGRERLAQGPAIREPAERHWQVRRAGKGGESNRPTTDSTQVVHRPRGADPTRQGIPIFGFHVA